MKRRTKRRIVIGGLVLGTTAAATAAVLHLRQTKRRRELVAELGEELPSTSTDELPEEIPDIEGALVGDVVEAGPEIELVDQETTE